MQVRGQDGNPWLPGDAVRASRPYHNDLALSLTIDNASSSAKTLTTMLIIAAIGIPIVLAYTVFIYRVFKGRVRHGELYGGH